jgi:hypothetical protein
MFQFPGFAHLAVYHAFSVVGCPIRTPADQFVFADPRSFSQLITSFFASESLGIPYTLLFTSFFGLAAFATTISAFLVLPMCSCLLYYVIALRLVSQYPILTS